VKTLPKCGLSDGVIERINAVFSRWPDVEQVILYGSRAKGTDREGSDIDLTIIGDALSQSHLLKIANELDDLLLPYKIDLSLLGQIEDKALLEHIGRVGVVFYVRKLKVKPHAF
jgi:predicted nucleotidyltransferase